MGFKLLDRSEFGVEEIKGKFKGLIWSTACGTAVWTSF